MLSVRLRCLFAAPELARLPETEARRHLIARIVVTDVRCKELETAARTWADRRVIHNIWQALWDDVEMMLKSSE
jgi:hypothetical protein